MGRMSRPPPRHFRRPPPPLRPPRPPPPRRPLRLPPVPAARAESPIDAFLVSRLAAEGLKQGPLAGRRELVRRLYFDLLGVPPSPAQIADFLADTAADAYPRLVADGGQLGSLALVPARVFNAAGLDVEGPPAPPNVLAAAVPAVTAAVGSPLAAVPLPFLPPLLFIFPAFFRPPLPLLRFLLLLPLLLVLVLLRP